jgi:hypothetical protein
MLQTVYAGVDTFTSDQLNSIWMIAQQCPQYGGVAVYRARALLNRIMDSIIYFPDTCAGAYSGFRREQPVAKVLNQSGYFSAYPNPANDNLVITFRNTVNQNSQTVLTITDLIGRTLETVLLTGDNGKTVLNTQNFDQGVYLLNWTDNSGISYERKIVILHK